MKRLLCAIVAMGVLCLTGCDASGRDAETDALERECAALDSMVGDNRPAQREVERRAALVWAQCHKEQRYPGIDDYARAYTIYETFKFDSAYKYADRCLSLARECGDQSATHHWMLNKARILTTAALFDEAQALLDSIDPSRLDTVNLPQYYNRHCVLYLFKAQFAQGTPYHERYNDSLQHYRSLVLSTAPAGSFLYKSTLANALCREGHVSQAVELGQQLLDAQRMGTHDYAVVASTLAYFYSCLGDTTQQQLLLARSARSDIVSNTMETSSLRELSSILFAHGDVRRAYAYLQRSIADANVYGTRLRNVQAATLVPHIVNVYEHEQARQQARIRTLLHGTLALLALLAVAAAVMWWLVRNTCRANRHVSEVNARMRENINIKEQYLARFLALCSTFIDEAHVRWRRLAKLMRDGKIAELKTALAGDAAYARSTKLFHQNFDAAFLAIYPDFVPAVNALLRPDQHIEVAAGEKLSSDLRLLALIRLGITDNDRIARILRTSVNTIYTYRSRLRNRAIDKDTFETEIARIATIE